MPKIQHYNEKPDPKFDAVYATKADTQAEFAKRLYTIMMNRGMNQSELARQASLHGSAIGRDSVSNYVRGLHLPTPAKLKQLCAALDVEIDELMPTARLPSVDKSRGAAPKLSMTQHKDAREGEVYLQINQVVPMALAVKIVAMLSEDGNG